MSVAERCWEPGCQRADSQCTIPPRTVSQPEEEVFREFERHPFWNPPSAPSHAFCTLLPFVCWPWRAALPSPSFRFMLLFCQTPGERIGGILPTQFQKTTFVQIFRFNAMCF